MAVKHLIAQNPYEAAWVNHHREDSAAKDSKTSRRIIVVEMLSTLESILKMWVIGLMRKLWMFICLLSGSINCKTIKAEVMAPSSRNLYNKTTSAYTAICVAICSRSNHTKGAFDVVFAPHSSHPILINSVGLSDASVIRLNDVFEMAEANWVSHNGPFAPLPFPFFQLVWTNASNFSALIGITAPFRTAILTRLVPYCSVKWRLHRTLFSNIHFSSVISSNSSQWIRT